MSCKIIKETLIEIEEQLGFKPKLYDGLLKNYNNIFFFDIELSHSCWMSKEYDKLINYAFKYKTFRVEQTGYKRVGIFLNRLCKEKM